MFIAGDIGGTKVRLASYEDKGKLHSLHEEKYISREFTDFSSLLKKFLGTLSSTKITSAALGIAGPIKDGVCKATNLPWIISAKQLEEELHIPRVFLINDLEANAWGLQCLEKSEFFVLNPGEPVNGNQALISAGTGLGEAGLYWDGKTHHPFACEGGHCDFSPTTDEEIALLRYLQQHYNHVSWERILSGAGLHQIYRFLIDTHRETENPKTAAEFDPVEPQRTITEKGLKGECKACVHTCQLFASLFGSEAGNLALKFLAYGGVFIGGGIAPRFAVFFQEDHRFTQAFNRKGRFSTMLSKIPVKVVLNDKTALLGAARYAQEKS